MHSWGARAWLPAVLPQGRQDPIQEGLRSFQCQISLGYPFFMMPRITKQRREGRGAVALGSNPAQLQLCIDAHLCLQCCLFPPLGVSFRSGLDHASRHETTPKDPGLGDRGGTLGPLAQPRSVRVV